MDSSMIKSYFFRSENWSRVQRPEATKTLLDPAPNPWRARQKKKKRRRRPQITFKSAESEIKAFCGACAPPSGAQAKSQYSQPNEYPMVIAVPHPQEASNSMLGFDRRAITVHGISPSENRSPSNLVEHYISKLGQYFSKIFAENESVVVCKAYRVRSIGTTDDSRPRPLKVILSSKLDLEFLLGRKKKLASFVPLVFFTEIIPYQSAWSIGRWRK